MSLLFLQPWEDVIPAGVAKQGQMTQTYGKYNFKVCDDPADCSLEWRNQRNVRIHIHFDAITLTYL